MIIVGGGVAGLSAAVNGASEGLKTLVLDSEQQFGGQAGSSTMIENYAGFAKGVTGESLTANMIDQARKFSADLIAPARVCGIKRDGRSRKLRVLIDDDTEYQGNAVILACGVQYRKLEARGLTDYLGRGVSYGSPSLSANYDNQEVYVIGGANSAGQAALHLSTCTGCKVNLLVRGAELHDKMSDYLIKRIFEKENITVRTMTNLESVSGGARLNQVTFNQAGTSHTEKADHVFVLIGATPKIGWLNRTIERDKHGFVLTGREVSDAFDKKYKRRPFEHESSLCGLFVAGDLRAGSIKRCAAAVGEGAVTIAEIHKYLEEAR